MPSPSAVMSAWISAFWYMAVSSAFSMLRILPRSGRIAWLWRERPCLAEPPAESPSTMKISDSSGSPHAQSASLPGSSVEPRTDLRRTSSRAAFAASAAFCAACALSMIAESAFGCRCRNSDRRSPATSETMARTSGEPSFCFVCPSNSASPSRTATIAHSPSRTKSPGSEGAFSRSLPLSRPTALTVRVRASLRPSMCVPPCGVSTPFAKPSRLSVYWSADQRSARSTCTPPFSARQTSDPSSKSGTLPSQMWSTYSPMPPRCSKVSGAAPGPARSSKREMRRPALR
mmetsp:Transcript_28265/g.93957  ORF Transcript_28265/g.93957 Transcript_28265/m.93957 type:complete len:288 (-) Transcript_28265:696-1559(-)